MFAFNLLSNSFSSLYRQLFIYFLYLLVTFKDNHHGADNIYVRAEQLLKYDDYPIWLKRDDTGTNNGRVLSEHHEEIIKETVLQNFNSDRFESGHYDVINGKSIT